jgi:hypothetical protein
MDEEYVQEHILTGGIVAPVGSAPPTYYWAVQSFRSALSRQRHIFSGLAVVCAGFEGRRRPWRCDALNHIALC